jgi:site-specific recombinase XerD
VFFKWLRKSEEYTEEVKWIKPRLKNGKKLPEEILTIEEVTKIAEAAENPRDRAFVLVLYESGCRIGELLPLKMKNVQFDENGAILLVNGKTGRRRVRIIVSSSALANWLEHHPFKNNPEAFVWIVMGTRNRYGMMSYAAIAEMLRKLAQRAGINKKVNPHAFRHARATHLASYFTEAQMKEFFGWVQSSDMAAIYVHLSRRDVDKALLKLHGLANEESSQENLLKIKVCPKCKEKNDNLCQFCKKCGTPLEMKVVFGIEAKKKMS